MIDPFVLDEALGEQAEKVSVALTAEEWRTVREALVSHGYPKCRHATKWQDRAQACLRLLRKLPGGPP